MNLNTPKLKRYGFNSPDKHGIITIFVMGDPSKQEKFTATLNFKNFYNELHDKLSHNEFGNFKDMLGEKKDKDRGDFFDYQQKFGEHMENKTYFNRTGDMFETHFMWAKKHNSVEMEMNWSAKMKLSTSEHGWVEFHLSLVNRFLSDKEVLVGNNKTILQGGAWEFRNKIVYKNKFAQTFQTTPILKNMPLLQGLYLDYIYYEKLLEELKFCEDKIKPLIYGVIHKYFT